MTNCALLNYGLIRCSIASVFCVQPVLPFTEELFVIAGQHGLHCSLLQPLQLCSRRTTPILFAFLVLGLRHAQFFGKTLVWSQVSV